MVIQCPLKIGKADHKCCIFANLLKAREEWKTSVSESHCRPIVSRMLSLSNGENRVLQPLSKGILVAYSTDQFAHELLKKKDDAVQDIYDGSHLNRIIEGSPECTMFVEIQPSLLPWVYGHGKTLFCCNSRMMRG